MKKSIYLINKNIILIMAFTFFLITASFAGGIDKNSFNNEEENNGYLDPSIVKVNISDKYSIGRIIDNDISIIEVNIDSLLVFASEEEISWLEKQNFYPEIVYENYAEMMGWNENPSMLDDFHKYTQLTEELQDIAEDYPDITALYDLGTSVQGRTIWGLKVTDNPDIEENEPEVRICGCHHGNEIMSVELPLNLAWHMVENYDSDQRIKDLVDNRETWIIPLVNPDGREVSNRVNANGVDLNRDYGYLWGAEGGSPSPFSQPETRAIREHALDNCFVLSLSYHTTAKYINYVWNYKGEAVADEDVVIHLSEMYGQYNDYVVIEGFNWYECRGDTNDFSYGCRGDIDWTIETENSNIPYVWDKNRDGMLDFIEAADMGVCGIVTDSETGMPVPATVWVEEIYWPCFIDPKIGDYHKPLLPGTYNLIFRANGYQEEERQVTVSSSGPTVLDVEIDRGGGRYAEQVTLANFFDPYNYPNSFQNNPTEAISALGPPDEEFASLGVGGLIVLDVGEAGLIYNCLGDDFTVFEGDSTSDGYTVSVSDAWDGPWTVIGTGSGTTSFDLDDEDLFSARFIKIKDDGDGSSTEMNPGFDLDAIENLNPDEVFVDDDFDSSTPGWGYDHFDNLQDAIDVVAGFGELKIYEGEYSSEEGIILEKPMIFIGEGETKPVIEGLENGNAVTILSDMVRIENLIIKDSGDQGFDSGVEISSDFNIIVDCDIIENKNGIVIDSSSKNNVLYHNNFMDNDQNALDTGFFNQWDNGYPSGGNYWDDYTGSDSDLDGIGDTPYYIPGGSNEDKYPLMKPYGYPNNPPTRPSIVGSQKGKPGMSYEYTFISTDEDNDEIYLTIDWGDGTIENTSFYPSGTELTESHAWGQEDTYVIRAKAIDSCGDESDWGQLQITIPRSKNVYNPLFISIFKPYPRLYLLLKLLFNYQF